MISLACVTDKEYLPYTNAMISSFKNYHKEVEIYIHYIGNKNEFTNNTVNIFYENINLSTKKNIIKNIDFEDNEFLNFFTHKNVLSKKNCYCNNQRFMFINNLLEQNIKNLIFIDADMLFNKNVDFLKTITYKKDVGLQSYFDKENYYKTNFMYINNTAKSRKVFNYISKNIDSEFGLYTWGHTKYFSNVIKLFDLNIAKLPENFVDTNYYDNSYVWSGENFRKNPKLVKQSTKNFKYIEKYKSYL